MKSCRTCKWADWQKNAIGNLLRKKHGACTYPLVLPKLPGCLKTPDYVFEATRYGIWPDDYPDCPCYEPKPKEVK